MSDTKISGNHLYSPARKRIGKFMFEARQETSHKLVLQKMVDVIAGALDAERVAFYALDKMNLLCVKAANKPEVLLDSHVKDIPPEGPMATVIENLSVILILDILQPDEQVELDSDGHCKPIKGRPLSSEVTADYIGKFGANFGRSGEKMSMLFGCLSLHDKTFGVFKADAFSAGRSILPKTMTAEELLYNVALISDLASHSLDELSTRMELIRAKKVVEEHDRKATKLMWAAEHAFLGSLVGPRGYVQLAIEQMRRVKGVRARRQLETGAGFLMKALGKIDNAAKYAGEYLQPLKSGLVEIKIEKKPVKVQEIFEDIPMVELAIENGLMDAIIVADKGKVRDIIFGLIENAEKYDGKGKPISISCKLAGDELEIRVKDQGVGLPPNQLKKIFEGGLRLQPEKEGSGWGLAGFKMITEMMGGTIRAESEGYNKGSTFIFTLPIV